MNKKAKRTFTFYQKAAAGVWTASVLLLAAGIFGFYMPQRNSLIQIHQRYQESCQKADLAKEAASEKARVQLEQQTEQVNGQLNALTIPIDHVSGLVFEVGRVANQLNLREFASKNTVDQSNTEKSKSKSKSKSLLSEAWLSVEFCGSYEQFARFVNLLERNSPAIFVEKVSVVRSNNSDSDNKFQLELSVLTTAGSNGNSIAMNF